MESKRSFIGTIVFLGLLLGVRSQQQCTLGGKPDAPVLQVPLKANLSLECNVSCLGPLSRGQLTWTDPRGAVVPSVPARLFTVNYNQWMTNRLILLDVTNGDSGVYKCEINHKGLHLQRFTIIRVEDITTAMSDPGPRRGDISVRSDPVFPEVRAVRSVSREAEVKYPSRTTKEESSSEPNGYFFAVLDLNSASMGDDLDSDDLATDARDPSNRAKRNVQSGNGEITLSQNESTQNPIEEQPTSSETPVTSPSAEPEPHADSTTKTTSDPQSLPESPSGESEPHAVSTSKTMSDPQSLPESPSGESEPHAVSTSKTMSDPQSLPESPSGESEPHAVSNTNTMSNRQTSSSQPSSASPASNSGSGASQQSPGGSNASTKDCHGKETTFGSHGLLAFAITLAIAVLLLYALLLVILVPRCCGKRRKQATLAGDGMTSPAEENVALMEKKHKKLEPMTSATGLNGEFITAVDLDAPDQNDGGQKAKDEAAEKKDDKEEDKEKKDDKEESTEESPESFVSTFLLGRLSSSKPEEGAEAAGVPGGEDDVFAGISGTGGDVKQTPAQSTSGDSTPAKEPQESEKKEEKLELDKLSTPPEENKTEIKFENEMKDSSGREAAGKDEGGSQQVQAPDGVQQQVSDIHVEVNKDGNVQDIPLLV